jgi:hypothetical protein
VIPCSGAYAPAQKWLQCKATDVTERSHGHLYVVLTTPIGNLSSGEIGVTVYLDWTVEFANPTLAQPAAEEAKGIFSEVTLAKSWTAPIFTDAIGSTGELSFKQNKGGGLVEWAGAERGTIYKLDPRCTIKMYTSATKVEDVGYAAVLPGKGDKNLYPFPAGAAGLINCLKAMRDTKTGKPSKYFAAGPESTGPLIWHAFESSIGDVTQEELSLTAWDLVAADSWRKPVPPQACEACGWLDRVRLVGESDEEEAGPSDEPPPEDSSWAELTAPPPGEA